MNLNGQNITDGGTGKCKRKKETIMSCPDQSTKYVNLTEKSNIGGIGKLPTR